MTSRRSFLQAACAAGLGRLALPHPVRAGQDEGASAASPDPDIRAANIVFDDLFLAEPAVFRPTAQGCTLHWLPRVRIEARTLIGPTPECLDLLDQRTTAQPTSVVIDDFGPGEPCFWQGQFRRPGEPTWKQTPVREVRTARLPGSSFRVALVADSHQYAMGAYPGSAENLARTITMVQNDRPDFVVFLGDEAGTKQGKAGKRLMGQARAMDAWAKWRRLMAPLLAATPSYLVLGNHDGEAGFHQHFSIKGNIAYYQRWSTVARKHYLLNPSFDTYPEGGENAGWPGDPQDPATGEGPLGNRSPLENYFAWSWGDALFVVLDVHRYTRMGQDPPTRVEDWTLGPDQFAWFESVLTSSPARWKFVMTHHLVGGYNYNSTGNGGLRGYRYGRGGAKYACVGEQAVITELMKRTGAQFFLYGHDHVFAHQQAHGVNFVCCGRPTWLSTSWWGNPGWREAYGDVETQPRGFYAAIGYVRLDISPTEVRLQYVCSGTDPRGAENVTVPVGGVVSEVVVT